MRLQILDLIDETREKGASLEACCKVINLSESTYRRWKKDPSIGDKRKIVDKTNPANKLTKEEEDYLYEILFSEQFADQSPHKVVPTLLDEGIYICSESTMYRYLRREKAVRRRTQIRKEDRRMTKPRLISYRPNQILTWDITFLPTRIRGKYFKMLAVMDLYSRKILKATVCENDSLKQSKDFFKEMLKELDIEKDVEYLHGDNGATLKGQTLSSLLRTLGIFESHSRPRVSNDNAHIESFFGTLKTNFKYPRRGFKSVENAQLWADGFMDYYNNEKHKSLGYITPNQKYNLEETAIKKKRKEVLKKISQEHPERFARGIRTQKVEKIVSIIPMSEEDIQEILQEDENYFKFHQISEGSTPELVEII